VNGTGRVILAGFVMNDEFFPLGLKGDCRVPVASFFMRRPIPADLLRSND
jgi:hypothetical protein